MAQIESRLCNLFRDYLKAADVSTGIPEDADLPKRAQDEHAEEITHPILILSAESTQETRRRIAKVTINIKISAQIGPEDESPSFASTWMQSVTDYLQDAAAWRAFIQSLPEAEKQGFQIIWQRLGAPVSTRNPDDVSLTILQPVMLSIALER